MLFGFNSNDNHIKFYIFGIKFLSYRIKENNNIYIINESGIIKKVNKIPRIKIKFTRSNSSVTIHKPFIEFKNNKITLGENCHVVIKKQTKEDLNGLKDVTIDIYQNSKLTIGSDFYNANSYYLIYNSALNIGNDCMFSSYLKFLCGDVHKIIDKDTNKIISDIPGELEIGNHVWIGYNSTILKNAHISSNTIIGASSVVAGKFEDSNIVIAGNPAKVVKHNVEWSK